MLTHKETAAKQKYHKEYVLIINANDEKRQ